MRLFRLFILSLALLAGLAARAEVVEIPGPQGPLQGEALAVPGARHVVVLIPGSGPTDRDGNGAGPWLQTDTYRLLAEALAAGGVASIRIDKRGMFGSAGAIPDANDVTIGAYAEDARAWVGRAAQMAPCVWLAGHSEGGLVALAAAQSPPESLCGLILLAAPGRPLGEVLLEQVGANPANAPLMPAMREIVADLVAGRRHPSAQMPAPLQPIFADVVQGFLIDLLGRDPAALARSWTGPALIVQGGRDIQITPADADRLAAAMPQARRVDLADATHLLKPDQPGDPFATYRSRSLPLHPALVPAILGFLAEHAR